MKLVSELISNEKYHYVELNHKEYIQDKLWSIGSDIQEHNLVSIRYARANAPCEPIKRIIEPISIMFSEYYFYVTAFISDEEIKKDFEVLNDSFPTIYRIDRIRELKILDEKFFIPYRNRFEEGEFRKRIQFMYGGKLRNVKFKYIGDDIDAILDRLPTAQILEEGKGYYIVKAEVFGKGIDMWLRSQGDKVEVMG